MPGWSKDSKRKRRQFLRGGSTDPPPAAGGRASLSCHESAQTHRCTPSLVPPCLPRLQSAAGLFPIGFTLNFEPSKNISLIVSPGHTHTHAPAQKHTPGVVQGCLDIPLLHTPWTNEPKRPADVHTPLPKRGIYPLQTGLETREAKGYEQGVCGATLRPSHFSSALRPKLRSPTECGGTARGVAPQEDPHRTCALTEGL